MNQHASDNPRIASTREVDCWENEGGADRAPHQEDSTRLITSEMRHFSGRRKSKSWSPKKFRRSHSNP